MGGNDEQRAASDPVGARVAAAVRALRANARLTLAEVAERAAEVGWPLSVASLLRLEQHKRKIEVGDLDALAQVFGIDPAQLLEGRVDVTVTGQVRAHAQVAAVAVHAGDATPGTALDELRARLHEAQQAIDEVRKALREEDE